MEQRKPLYLDVIPAALHVAVLHVQPFCMLSVMDVADSLPHSAVALESRAKTHLQQRHD